MAGITGPDANDPWKTTRDYVLGKKRAEEALGFLTSAGACIANAMTFPDAAQGTIDLTTPFLADWTSISLFAPGGEASTCDFVSSSRGAVKPRETYQDLALALSALVGHDEGAAKAPVTVSATNGADTSDDIAKHLLGQAQDAGVAAAIAIPLIANGRVQGSLVALRVAARRQPDFGDAALLLLSDVSSRLAGAAELFALRERDAVVR
jgi:GAF domain-containing protein